MAATGPMTKATAMSASEMDQLVRASQSIAHDLRNVFSVINACAVDLYDEMHGRQAAGLVLEILNAGERGLLAATELLQAGRTEVEPVRPINLARQLLELEPILRRLAAPGVALEIVLPAVPLWAAIDRTSLMQVLMNLVANASDATDRCGLVQIECSQGTRADGRGGDTEVVSLAVRDKGRGFTASERERVFEDGFSTKEGAHWGLGLSVVRRVVERCHGWIEVCSAVGEGTTVEVQLALAEPVRSGLALVVVSDDLRRVWLADSLAALGLSVVSASDPVDACDLVGTLPIADIAVLDEAAAADRGLRHMARLDLVTSSISLAPGCPASLEDGHLIVVRCAEALTTVRVSP